MLLNAEPIGPRIARVGRGRTLRAARLLVAALLLLGGSTAAARVTSVWIGVDTGGVGVGDCTLDDAAFLGLGAFDSIVSLTISDEGLLAAAVSCGEGSVVGGVGSPPALDSGLDGSDSIEVEVDAGLIGAATFARFAVASLGAGGETDFVFTEDGTAASPIATATFFAVVPALGTVGLFLLCAALIATAWTGRRYPAMLLAGVLIVGVAGAWRVTAAVGGSLGHWAGIEATASDPAGDALDSTGLVATPAVDDVDLRGFFQRVSADGLLLRIDLEDLEVDACDGVDCSHLDSSCTFGVCDLATGACGSERIVDGSACDDGDACTTADACEAGICTGSGSCDSSCAQSEGVEHGDCDGTCDFADAGADCDGACDGSAEIEGSDCDGICDPRDLAGGPDCPFAADRDGDGTIDALDLCPEDDGSAGVDVGSGCSALGLLTSGSWVVAEPLARIVSARELLGTPDGLADAAPVAGLDTAASDVATALEAAVSSWASGEPCDASAFVSSAGAEFAAQLEAHEAAWNLFRPGLEVADFNATPAQHFEDGALRTVYVELAIAELEKVASLLEPIEALATAACEAVTDEETTLTGWVSSIDAARRILWLDHGEGPIAIGLPEDLSDPGVAKGFGATATGKGQSDGSLLSSSVDSMNSFDSSPINEECIGLRIAPWQGFTPHVSGAPVLHLPGAYQPGGTLNDIIVLEDGARLAAYEGTCPGTTPGSGGSYFEYSLHFGQVLGPQLQILKNVWVPEIRGGDTPVDPMSATPLAAPTWVTVTVEARRRTCIHPPPPPNGALAPCSVGEILWTHDIELYIMERGALCEAVYDRNVFELEDGDYTSYQEAEVVSLSLWSGFSDLNYAGTPIATTFSALGCKTSGSSHSCASDPLNLASIGESEGFAVRNLDPIDGSLWTEQTFGVKTRSALVWPYIGGTRSGSTFRYSCTLPTLVRDRITECLSEDADSYYRYPFFPGSGDGWWLSNGNQHATFPGHSGHQAFAFDLRNDEGVEIRAARGGRVTIAKSSAADSLNQWDCYADLDACRASVEACQAWADPSAAAACVALFDCANTYPCDNGNMVFVVHDDGSYGVYFHLQQTGFNVSAGQTIERGHVIGRNGTTGRSSDPHLHFQSQLSSQVDGWVGPVGSKVGTIPVRFETSNDTCFLPWPGDSLDSNNGP